MTEPPALEPLEQRHVLAASIPGVSPLVRAALANEGAAAVFASVPNFEVAATAQGVSGGAAANLGALRADPRFAGITGQCFTSVIIDTGINASHPFFGPDANGDGVGDRIVYQHDFTGGGGSGTANDGSGHGTHVASLIAGGAAGGTYSGVAPGAGIIALKVLSGSGSGSFALVEEALQWVVANVSRYNIASVNLSLGDGTNGTVRASRYGLGDELGALAARGVIVTAAAGNSYGAFQSPGLAYPASDPSVIAVGAVFSGSYGGATFSQNAVAYSSGVDVITPFSQRSGAMDIFAPGAFLSGAARTGSGVVSMAGTSMASPIIAGAAVLAQQAATEFLGRRLTTAEFRTLLTSTADVINDGDNENDNVTNTGANYRRVNVHALASAIAAMAGDAPAQPGEGGSGGPEPAAPTAPASPPTDTPGVNDAPYMSEAAPLVFKTSASKRTISYSMLAKAADEMDPDRRDKLVFEVTVLQGAGKQGRFDVVEPLILRKGKSFSWSAPATAGAWEALRIRVIDAAGLSSASVTVEIRWNVAVSRSDAGARPSTIDPAALGAGLRLGLRSGTASATAIAAHPPVSAMDYTPRAVEVLVAPAASGSFFT